MYPLRLENTIKYEVGKYIELILKLSVVVLGPTNGLDLGPMLDIKGYLLSVGKRSTCATFDARYNSQPFLMHSIHSLSPFSLYKPCTLAHISLTLIY